MRVRDPLGGVRSVRASSARSVGAFVRVAQRRRVLCPTRGRKRDGKRAVEAKRRCGWCVCMPQWGKCLKRAFFWLWRASGRFSRGVGARRVRRVACFLCLYRYIYKYNMRVCVRSSRVRACACARSRAGAPTPMRARGRGVGCYSPLPASKKFLKNFFSGG